MINLSKLEMPGFYRFVRRKTRRKIYNKQRMGYRGPKLRYAVWRAQYNEKWEKCDQDLVERICRDNNLSLEEHMVAHERTPWEHTLKHLRAEGYGLSKKLEPHTEAA